MPKKGSPKTSCAIHLPRGEGTRAKFAVVVTLRLSGDQAIGP